MRLQPPPDVSKQVGSFVLVLQGHPEAVNDIDQDQAVNIALSTMARIGGSNGTEATGGYQLTSAYHAFGLIRVKTRDGHSSASFDKPIDAWVLEFTAPPQQGFVHVSAFAIVNARTGKIESFSELKTN